MNALCKSMLFIVVGCLAILLVGHFTGHWKSAEIFYGTFSLLIALLAFFCPSQDSKVVAAVIIYGGIAWVIGAETVLNAPHHVWSWQATALTAFVCQMMVFGILNMIPTRGEACDGFFMCLIPNPPSECRGASGID